MPLTGWGLQCCTNMLENFRDYSLKRDLSNDTTANPSLFSLVNTFKHGTGGLKVTVSSGYLWSSRQRDSNLLSPTLETRSFTESQHSEIMRIHGVGDAIETCIFFILGGLGSVLGGSGCIFV
jgi:hypothetical protein